jgi:hypothetical protein
LIPYNERCDADISNETKKNARHPSHLSEWVE